MNYLLLLGSFLSLLIFSVGVRMNKNPKSYKSLLAYRTASSKRNEDTWYEANQYAGRCLMAKAAVLLFLLSISEVFSIDKIMMLKLVVAYLVLGLFLVIYCTERRLRKIFFRDGKRRPTVM